MESPKLVALQILISILLFKQTHSLEDGYLRYVKDGCFIKGEALSCVKYKALKIAKKTLFGDNFYSNETIKANHMISFVPLDDETIQKLSADEKVDQVVEPKGFMSEWAELAKYFMKLMKNFFKVKGLRVNLPEGARTIEDNDDVEVNDDGEFDKRPGFKETGIKARGKKKKLAIIIPLLTLLTAMKTKLLLIPVLLSVLLLKKLLLVGALLLPSLLNTLKACKHHTPYSSSYSYFGSNDNSEFNSDYGSNYAYSSGAGYNKDWASNRAYSMQKHHRPTVSPVYITAPGSAV